MRVVNETGLTSDRRTASFGRAATTRDGRAAMVSSEMRREDVVL
jgi:hypothetical protein